MKDRDPVSELAALEEEVASHPDSVDAIHDLGDAYADLERWADAIAAYEKAISLGEPSADLHNSLGVAYEEAGEADGAAGSYRRAIALDPEDGFAYQNLGSLLEEQQRPDEAIAVYDEGARQVADRYERSSIRRKLLRLTTGTVTGQSPLAYRVAAIVLLVGGVLVTGIASLVTLNPAGIAGVTIDALLITALFGLRPGARNFTLFRAIAGAVLGPLLIGAEAGGGLIQAGANLLGWGYCGALLLLLTGRTRPWRITVSILLAAPYVGVSLAGYVTLLVALLSG
jgi:tetratricopeptide (TPR) repeat protein